MQLLARVIRGLFVVIEILSPISRRVNQSTVQMVLTRLILRPPPPPLPLIVKIHGSVYRVSRSRPRTRSQLLFKVSINLIETISAHSYCFWLITRENRRRGVSSRRGSHAARSARATRFHFSRLTFNYPWLTEPIGKHGRGRRVSTPGIEGSSNKRLSILPAV